MSGRNTTRDSRADGASKVRLLDLNLAGKPFLMCNEFL